MHASEKRQPTHLFTGWFTRSGILSAGTLLLLSAAVALLWYPLPPFSLAERLIAAIMPVSLVLAWSLRLFAWRWLDEGDDPSRAQAWGLLGLALGTMLLVAAGGPLYALVRAALPAPVLLLLAVAGIGVSSVGQLLIIRDLERLLQALTQQSLTESDNTDGSLSSAVSQLSGEGLADRSLHRLIPNPAIAFRGAVGPIAEAPPVQPVVPGLIDSVSTEALGRRTWSALMSFITGIAARVGQFADMALIVALALSFRLYSLATLPYGLHGDEAIAGLEGLRILREGGIGPYSPSALGMPAGPLYFTALSVGLLGSTIFAARLPAAVIGTLTIAALYLMLRRNFGAHVALAGAGALAVMTWHIHFSRVAFPIITWPLVATLTMGALAEALRRGSWHWWAATGALATLGIYVYNAHYLFLGTFGLFIAILFVWRRRWPLRQELVGLGAFLLGLALVGLRMALYIVDPRTSFFHHFQHLSIFSRREWQELSNPIERMTFLAGRYIGFWDKLCCHPRVDGVDGSGVVPDIPLLMLLLAGVGIVLAVRRRQHPLVFLGLLLLVLMPVAAVVTLEEPTRRAFILVPVLAMFAALGLVELARLARQFPAVYRPVARAGLAALVGLIVFQSLTSYFVGFTSSPAQSWVFVRPFTDAALFVQDLPAGSYVYFYSDRWSFNYETRQFLAPKAVGQDFSAEFGKHSLDIDHSKGTPVFVLLGKYRGMLDELNARYPKGKITTGGPSEDPSFVAYTLEPKLAATAPPTAPSSELAAMTVRAHETTVLIGPGGVTNEELQDPRGLALDHSGALLVVETGRQWVARIAPDGRLLGRIGTPGSRPGQFEEPVAVAVDASGAIHILDAARAVIQVFSPDGTFKAEYGDEFKMFRPRGLAIGDDGLIYIADTGRNRVLRVRPDGELQDSIPADPVRQPPVIDQPTAAVGRGGSVYVAEPTRARLTQFAPGMSEPATFQTLGSTNTQRSARVLLGTRGELIVADLGNRQVVLACPTGSLLVWRPERTSAAPLAAALTADAMLYVVDTSGHLVAFRLERSC